MPDFHFDTLDKVPEELRGHAKQNGEKFTVNVVPAASLKEFRDNNVKFLQERDAANAKVTTLTSIVGEDPDKFKEELTGLRSIAQQVKDGTLKGDAATTKEIEARVAAAGETLRKDIAARSTELVAEKTASAEWKNKYEREVLNGRITASVVSKDSPANPEALPDILSRAASVFHITPSGQMVPKDGDQVIYGADGSSPMTLNEWLVKLVAASPYLGKMSAGGGANGSRDKGKGINGMTDEAFQALPPADRIKMHRKAQAR